MASDASEVPSGLFLAFALFVPVLRGALVWSFGSMVERGLTGLRTHFLFGDLAGSPLFCIVKGGDSKRDQQKALIFTPRSEN